MPPTTRVTIDPVVLRVPVYETATTLTDDESILPGDEPQPSPPSSVVTSPAAAVFQRRMLTFGLPAMLLGTLGNAVVAGLAFRSYRNTKSVVRPAVIIGVGGLAVSGLSLFLLMKSLDTSDNRLAAMGTGLWISK